MKHLVKFNEHYKFKIIEDVDNYSCKSYEFVTKDNINIIVKFCQLGVKSQKYYTREYYTIGTKRKYAELDNNDSFAILDTVTKITLQFIKDFSPERIEIDHIPTFKERQNTDFTMDYLANNATTKRAIINKRFLERDLPHTYSYDLVKSKSIITKNPSL